LRVSHFEFKEISAEEDLKSRRTSTAKEQFRDPHIHQAPERYTMDLTKGSGVFQGSEILTSWDTTNRQTFKVTLYVLVTNNYRAIKEL
jgi:hypothetical protein